MEPLNSSPEVEDEDEDQNMPERKKLKQDTEPIPVPFVSRLKRLHHDEATNTAYFMPLLNSGEDSDFKIALKDTPNGYIAVHSMVLKARSSYFKSMLNSNMKEASKQQVIFKDFDDGTVENALECIYSYSINHMAGSDSREVAALIGFLVYIDLQSIDDISALFSMITCEREAKSLLVGLEQVLSCGIENYIPKQKLDTAIEMLASRLFVHSFIQSLERECAESFCKLDESIIRILIVKHPNPIMSSASLVLRLLALWTSYAPNQRILHTINLIESFKSFFAKDIRPYTKGSKEALSMVDSGELQALLPEHSKARPETSELLLSYLDVVMLKLDRDTLLYHRY